jgi:hypothetical protein
VHVCALDAHARLAGVEVRAPGDALRRRLDVGVVGDDDRILTATLDEHRRQTLRARRHDLASGARRTGERHLVHAGTAQRGADVAHAVHDLQYRVLGYDLVEDIDEELARHGGVFAGLEDHGVTRRQGVGDRTHRRENREIPRADDPDHAVRLVFQEARVFGLKKRAPDPA